MSSLLIVVQPRESDENAAELLKRLMEKTNAKPMRDAEGLNPNTIVLSFRGIADEELDRLVTDSKQWADDAGFLFLLYKDAVYSSVSLQDGSIENENVTVASLLELE